MNPFNGIESLTFILIGVGLCLHRRIHSMELKVLSNVLGYGIGKWITESIQWNWKYIHFHSLPPSITIYESIQWNWKSFQSSPAQPTWIFSRIHSMELKVQPWHRGSGRSRPTESESIQWNWKNIYVCKRDQMVFEVTKNPFNGIESYNIVGQLLSFLEEVEESIQWNWK